MTLIPFYIITDYNIQLKNAAFSFFLFVKMSLVLYIITEFPKIRQFRTGL